MSITKGERKYWVIAIGLIVLFVIFIRLAQSSYAQSTNKTDLELVKEDKLYYNEHPSFEDELREAPEVANMQLESWKRTVAKLQEILPVEDWKLISSGDIDIYFTNFLPSQEVATFNLVFYGDERKAALEVGDIFPGALISPNQDQVILLWEKGDGRATYIHIDSKTDSAGNRTWALNGEANIIDISNINPEDIHIPLKLDTSNNLAAELEGLELQYARGYETGGGIKVQANYQLPDGKSQILVSQSLNSGGLDALEQLKSNFDPENLTETEINGHKALIEEGRVRGQVFMITDTYFYMVGSTDSLDISMLKAVAEQIDVK